MFRKLLVANRGEIACRVIRSARKLGVETVAVYSDADERALHRYYADEAHRVGEAPSLKSYLNAEAILQIAHATGAGSQCGGCRIEVQRLIDAERRSLLGVS